MYRFWDSIIEPALSALRPKSILEIGASAGKHTSLLLRFCQDHAARLQTIDPQPTFDVASWRRDHANTFVLLQGKSLEILPQIQQADVVLIDGDHNWYTVFHELQWIGKLALQQGRFPLVFLHDIDWPYARRDLYYDPADIPEPFRQPHQKKSIHPDDQGMSQDLGLNADLFHATEEGGPHNGVLTAIEDFLEQSPHPPRFLSMPGMHGLGILVSDVMLNEHPPLRAFLNTLTLSAPTQSLLRAVDRARIDSLMRETSTQKSYDEVEAYARRLQKELDTVSGQRQAAQTEIDGLRTHIDEARRREQELTDIAEMQQSTLREKEATIAAALLQLKETQQREQRLTEIRAHLENTVRELERYLRETTEALREDNGLLRSQATEQQGVIDRMQRSRSWRWTEPIRKFEARLRGKHIVHPEQSMPAAAIPAPVAPPIPATVSEPLDPAWILHYTPTVAVILPCHQYGNYLPEALESVLAQTRSADEILIVDDASTDDTKQVAEAYAHRGIRYLRGEWKNVGAARNAGLHATKADYLVFLNADDTLDPEYIRLSLDALLQHRTAALAYTDQQYFGDSDAHVDTPPTFDWKRFDAQNQCHPAWMVRRDALLQAGGWSHGIDQDSDWVTWRSVLQLGWDAVKSNGLFLHRVHDNNMQPKQTSYGESAGFLEEPTTLCLSLSGRAWAWPLTKAFLERQTYPHDRMHLIILDTSQNSTFGKEVKTWLAECDYGSYTYHTAVVGPKGLADLPRAEAAVAVASACAGIYNRFARMVKTSLVCFLEDDIVPPDDVYPRLIRSFAPDVVSVSALSFQRGADNQPIVWKWTPNGHPLNESTQQGVTMVGGNGFGCCVVRGEYVRRTTFRSGPKTYCFDHNFYRDHVYENKMNALVDWNCVCRHHHDALTWN